MGRESQYGQQQQGRVLLVFASQELCCDSQYGRCIIVQSGHGSKVHTKVFQSLINSFRSLTGNKFNSILVHIPVR